MTNEPTTGEIVRALRCDGDANNCVDCRYATYDTATILCDQEQNVRDAADRLESQERTIAELTEKDEWSGHACDHMINKLRDELRELTARAESAERERDAAIKELEVIEQDGLCSICKFESTIPLMECMENCVFKWRGQPQDGEWK